MITDAAPDCGYHILSRRRFILAMGASFALCSTGFASAVDRQKRTVKVGIILPEQGFFSQDAKSLIAGFDCYFKETGHSEVEVLRRDSGPSDEKTIEALTGLLVTHNVDFLISPLSLDGAEKAVHGLSNSSAVLFVTNPSVKLIAGELCLSRTFRVRPNTYQRAYPLGPWALKNLGKCVFITGSDDREGNETADFFAHGFEKSGGTFGDRLMVSPGANNFRGLIDAIEKSRGDFIFAAFGKKDTLGFLRAMEGRKNNGIKKLVIGPESLTAFPGLLASLGKTAQGIKTLCCLKNPSDLVQRIKRIIGIDVSDAERAAEGYDIARIVDLSTKNASWDSQDPTPLIEYIQNLAIKGPRGNVKFDRNHEPILDMFIQEWQFSARTPEQKIVYEMPEVRSLDFGCGRVGFPHKPGGETNREESLWEDLEE